MDEQSAAVILVLPLAVWLATAERGPFQYAAARAPIEGAKRAHYFGVKFVIGQAVSAAPLFLLILWSGMIRLGRSTDARLNAISSPASFGRRLTFLMFVALGPILLAVSVAVLFNARLRTAWGSPIMCPLGLLLVALLSQRVDQRTV